jgi:hypothetical protein
MRLLVIELLLIGCNRELSFEPIREPKGWSKTTSRDADAFLLEIGVEYRERKNASIVTYKSPAGDHLLVVTFESQIPMQSLLVRLGGERGLHSQRHTIKGQFTVDTLGARNGLHVGFQIAPEPSDNPEAIERSQMMIATCMPANAAVPTMYDSDPCVRAVHKSIDALKSDSDDWWIYSYAIGIVFAVLILGHWLQLGRRLLPPKGPSGLPEARVRK